ncbi:MAG: heterodisulfide reductase-related iron-sulfur binding cluster [Chloroflexota bacterium]|nr:heterodisulfide reductase-related iron-sulfur binding cluster [Chloroflexota bacterium]
MVVAEITDANLMRLGGFSGLDIPEDDLLRACVHCGMCLSSCPTYRLTGQEMSSPRGRLWLMRAVADDRMDLLDPLFDEQMYQCLNCRACEAVCPSGVHYGPLVEASRAQLETHRRRPLWQRAAQRVGLRWLFAQPNRIRALTNALRLYQRTKFDRLVRRAGILRLLGMEDMERLLPPIVGRALIPGRERWEPAATTATNQQTQLFNGCVMGTVFANTNRAAARVLAHNGSRVDVPVGQHCCGALQVHAGIMAEARVLARQNIDAFERAGDDPIIVTAAGCGAALKEYGFLLKDDPVYAERAAKFSARVQDVTEYLAAHEIVPPTVPVNRVVTYQEPCHLAHAQRITAQPRQLLNAVPGLELVEMRESSLCCGSAGIYNIIRKQMADDLGDRKARHILATDAVEVVTANPGCAMQLRASLGRNGSTARVRHIVDVLDESYGGAKTQRAIVSSPLR